MVALRAGNITSTRRPAPVGGSRCGHGARRPRALASVDADADADAAGAEVKGERDLIGEAIIRNENGALVAELAPCPINVVAGAGFEPATFGL